MKNDEFFILLRKINVHQTEYDDKICIIKQLKMNLIIFSELIVQNHIQNVNVQRNRMSQDTRSSSVTVTQFRSAIIENQLTSIMSPSFQTVSSDSIKTRLDHILNEIT